MSARHDAIDASAHEPSDERSGLARTMDRWVIGLIAGTFAVIFAAGVGWGNARADVSGKLDRTTYTQERQLDQQAFADFRAQYRQDRATDSIQQRYRDNAIGRIEANTNKLLCRAQLGGCP